VFTKRTIEDESRTPAPIPQGKVHAAGASVLQSVSGASSAFVASAKQASSESKPLEESWNVNSIENDHSITSIMKSFIAATLFLVSLGYSAPPATPSITPPSSPSKSIVVPPPWKLPQPPNKLPDEAVEALKSGVKFILFSLEPPITIEDDKEVLKPEQKHHGFKILGSTELVNAVTKDSAIASITEGVKKHTSEGSGCFLPRHSLRVTAANGKIYDFLTCFQCTKIEVYVGDKRIGGAGIVGSQKPLDDILTAAKIPLAKPMEGEN
jgi:hypothetical protein